MCTINEVWLWLYHYDVWFLRYKVQTTRLFVIFHPPNKPKNQNFEKIGKRLEILSFYTCAARMTIIWCMVPEISSATDIIFLSCWAIFCPFTHPLTTQKIKILKNEKTPGGIIILNMSTINENQVIYDSWNVEHNWHNFSLFWTIFWPFTPCTPLPLPNNPKN